MRKGKRGTPDMLTPDQVAARYGMSVQWVYHCPEMIAIRRKVGKYCFYSLADLERVEKMDRDKPTGAKTVPLEEFKKDQLRKAEDKQPFTFEEFAKRKRG